MPFNSVWWHTKIWISRKPNEWSPIHSFLCPFSLPSFTQETMHALSLLRNHVVGMMLIYCHWSSINSSLYIAIKEEFHLWVCISFKRQVLWVWTELSHSELLRILALGGVFNWSDQESSYQTAMLIKMSGVMGNF